MHGGGGYHDRRWRAAACGMATATCGSECGVQRAACGGRRAAGGGDNDRDGNEQATAACSCVALLFVW
jgi:hypothetical protein